MLWCWYRFLSSLMPYWKPHSANRIAAHSSSRATLGVAGTAAVTRARTLGIASATSSGSAVSFFGR